MIRKRIVHIALMVTLATVIACNEDEGGAIQYTPDPEVNTVEITTDKAIYNPGDNITFSAHKTYDNAFIRYTHLGNVIEEVPMTGASWTWAPPSQDFKGYMAEVFIKHADGTEETIGTVGIDVSSDWTKFPRYGFLSKYGQMSQAEMESIIGNLNKYHINGIQFYDWMYRQHQPLAGTVNEPMEVWNDIMNRDIYKSTVDGYIQIAHDKNMKAMFYNLAYGVLDDYDPDAITPQMFIYKDTEHSTKDMHELGAPFISNIYLTDPANSSWQEYLAQRNEDVYEVFDFDGYHIDQLGDRGTVYRYDGSSANLSDAFPSFISAMKSADPDKELVFNAVNQYAQQQIADEELGFLYTEVWSPNEGFKDLSTILTDNAAYSNNTKNTVLAAYINYNKANGQGLFNTPGVLLADAVIFAFGGSHLELGEHMLAKEYFPNNNLSMTDELKAALMEYYDFMVAYQNLLRDGGNFNEPVINTGDGKLNLGSWPPTMGKVAAVGKQVENKQVVHLINFTNANNLNWRDTEGAQSTPASIEKAMVNLQINGTVNKIWYASPDYKGGVAVPLEYTQNGSTVNFKVPLLKYWGMIVVE
ncbi:glycoside hydrolase family 66 protein [Flavobacterium sp.]|uniref:glycoside hydrolase family 66 protein n=1 Tax=Flavobacterium sp. TaxID=239 RepID=UPI003A8EEE67